MPTLHQVMAREIGDAAFRDSPAWVLRDEQVVAIYLDNGAPCSSHDSMFAPWPGTEHGTGRGSGGRVTRWFALSAGQAVGIDEDNEPPRVMVWDAAPGPT